MHALPTRTRRTAQRLLASINLSILPYQRGCTGNISTNAKERMLQEQAASLERERPIDLLTQSPSKRGAHLGKGCRAGPSLLAWHTGVSAMYDSHASALLWRFQQLLQTVSDPSRYQCYAQLFWHGQPGCSGTPKYPVFFSSQSACSCQRYRAFPSSSLGISTPHARPLLTASNRTDPVLPVDFCRPDGLYDPGASTGFCNTTDHVGLV